MAGNVPRAADVNVLRLPKRLFKYTNKTFTQSEYLMRGAGKKFVCPKPRADRRKH